MAYYAPTSLTREVVPEPVSYSERISLVTHIIYYGVIKPNLDISLLIFRAKIESGTELKFLSSHSKRDGVTRDRVQDKIQVAVPPL